MKKHVMNRLLSCLGLAIVILISGCEEATEGEVSGTITVDGELAGSGSIGFIPVDGRGSTAGGPITDGQYKVMVPFGTAKVQIRVQKVVGQVKIYDTPDSPIQDVRAEILPPRFNDETELTLEVGPGKTVQDYDLTTKRSK